MPEHTIRSGDCISSLALRYNTTWQAIWYADENADLRRRRPDPNVLFPGDVLVVPEPRAKQEACATDARHKFRRLGVPVFLKLRLLDAAHSPLGNADYVLEVDGNRKSGKTDGSGFLKQAISPAAEVATLTYKSDGQEIVFELELGGIDPLAEAPGTNQRLENLGFKCGEQDQDDMLRDAVRGFQQVHGLDVSGELDERTKAKLQEIHGC
jgi:N-acetylmuramoyl-L-alanine amidase